MKESDKDESCWFSCHAQVKEGCLVHYGRSGCYAKVEKGENQRWLCSGVDGRRGGAWPGQGARWRTGSSGMTRQYRQRSGTQRGGGHGSCDPRPGGGVMAYSRGVLTAGARSRMLLCVRGEDR